MAVATEQAIECGLLPEPFTADAVAMAAMAADAAMELDRAGEAAEWCMRGLAIDRFADRLWKQLEVAHNAAGDVASAARTRAAYAEVRRELGLS